MSFSLKRLEAAYRHLLTVPRDDVKMRLIEYIFRNGLFDNISGEVQEAVVNLIDDDFMDKLRSYMESRLQMLRISQSADIIATQTPKSASSSNPPTPATPVAKASNNRG